jgi:hypothetical protein
MKTLVLLIVVWSIPLLAQDAQVVELDKTDATQAKQLYEAKIAADKAWDSFNATVKLPKGFPSQFEFSKDFRFIVPKTPPLTISGTYWPLTCVTTNTGTGTVTGGPLTTAPWILTTNQEAR